MNVAVQQMDIWLGYSADDQLFGYILNLAMQQMNMHVRQVNVGVQQYWRNLHNVAEHKDCFSFNSVEGVDIGCVYWFFVLVSMNVQFTTSSNVCRESITLCSFPEL